MNIHQFAGKLVAGKYLCRACAFVSSIICAINNIVTDHNGTGPIEAALNDIAPKCLLSFGGVFSIFIGNRNANISRILSFTVPETRINITIRICYGRKCLTFKRVAVNPKGFKGFCIERLNGSVGERCENHTVGVCCRSIAPVNSLYHFALSKNFAVRHTEFINVFTAHRNKAVINYNLYAGCCNKAGTKCLCPFFRCFACGARELCGNNSHIIVISAEARPFGGNCARLFTACFFKSYGKVVVFAVFSVNNARLYCISFCRCIPVVLCISIKEIATVCFAGNNSAVCIAN